MYTFCTHCQTAQEVTREMLVPTRGELECSHCRQRFDALETLSRDPPPGRIVARRKTVPDDIQPSLFTAPLPAEPMHPAASVPAHGERSDPIAEILCAHADFIEPPVPEYDDAALAGAEADALSPTDADEGRAPQAHATSEPQDASSEETPAQDAAAQVSSEAVDSPAPQSGTVSPPRDAVVLDLRDALDLALRAPAPSFRPGAQTPATERSARRWPALFAVLALFSLLLAQSLFAERNALAADARWRPWLERICDPIGCRLPTWHQPDALHVLTRDVRPHPSVPEALIISASFRNDARWAQPWPDLELTLSDINGQPIAHRRFAPEEYLGHLQGAALVAPGQSASIALEVRDPGKQAVAFEFEFH